MTNLTDVAAAKARRAEQSKRRAEIVSLVLAGEPFDTVAERFGITADTVQDVISRTLAAAPTRADQAAQVRTIEMARLDRAQAAIWPAVIQGDLPAVETWLKLSTRRSKLLGLDAPTQIHVALDVRARMDAALRELEQVVLGEVVRGELPAAAD